MQCRQDFCACVCLYLSVWVSQKGLTGLVCVGEVLADWYVRALHHCRALTVKRGQRPAQAMMGNHRGEEDSDLVNITLYFIALGFSFQFF